MRKLRVVVLYSAGHLGSAIVFNVLSRLPYIEIVALVKAPALKFSKAGKSALQKQIKTTGWHFAWMLFWQRLVQALTYGFTLPLWLLFPRLRPKILLPGWFLAAQKDIPVHHTASINSEASKAFLRKCKPDLLLSCYFNQILSPEVLQIPESGALNLHPGLLPAYRGAMCYFWVLHNRAEKAGVTLHWMDETIDTGNIVAHSTFTIPPHSTQHQMLIHSALLGSKLLARTLRKLANNQSLPTVENMDEDADYFPMPGSEAFNHYFQRHRFFRIRDIFHVLLLRAIQKIMR